MNRRDFLRVTGLAGVAGVAGVLGGRVDEGTQKVEQEVEQEMVEKLGISNYKYAWIEDTLTPRTDADYSDGYTIIYEPDNI